MLACYCWDKGLDFWTEATFANGSGRADFIISDWKLVVEVLHSEEVKTFANKRYPLNTVGIRSTATIFDVKEMLDDFASVEDKNDFHTESYRKKILVKA